MSGARVTKVLTAWREVLAASEDSIQLSEALAGLTKVHPEIEMPPRALLICAMTSMLTSILSVESVVNDILQNIVRDEYGAAKWQANWAEIERLPLKDKVWHVCDLMGFASPLDSHPFVMLDEMLDFRARIVHAKLELVEVQHALVDASTASVGDDVRLVTAWERACTMENAVRFCDAARGMAHWFILNSGGRFGSDTATIERSG